MQHTMKVINLVHLEELSGERSSRPQVPSTRTSSVSLQWRWEGLQWPPEAIKSTMAHFFSCSLQVTTYAQCLSALLAPPLALCAPSEPPLTTITPPLPLCFYPTPWLLQTCPGNATNPGEPPGTRIPSPVTIDSQPLSELCLPILAAPTDTPTTLSPPCAPQKWRPHPPQCILHRCL
jgi:hypothetical protein